MGVKGMNVSADNPMFDRMREMTGSDLCEGLAMMLRLQDEEGNAKSIQEKGIEIMHATAEQVDAHAESNLDIMTLWIYITINCMLTIIGETDRALMYRELAEIEEEGND